jgi:hypothetical protein
MSCAIFFIYEVRDGKVRFAQRAQLGAHEQAYVSLADATPVSLEEGEHANCRAVARTIDDRRALCA